MRVIVQNIARSSTGIENSFDVSILLDNHEHHFLLNVEIVKIEGKELRMITTDREFDDIFKYDIEIHRRICKLVSAVYNHRPIDLPCDVGELEIDREKNRPLLLSVPDVNARAVERENIEAVLKEDKLVEEEMIKTPVNAKAVERENIEAVLKEHKSVEALLKGNNSVDKLSIEEEKSRQS